MINLGVHYVFIITFIYTNKRLIKQLEIHYGIYIFEIIFTLNYRLVLVILNNVILTSTREYP